MRSTLRGKASPSEAGHLNPPGCISMGAHDEIKVGAMITKCNIFQKDKRIFASFANIQWLNSRSLAKSRIWNKHPTGELA